ncbi:MAG: TonB-dependent receptor plug domain-containing protein, partial [Bacteroidales bacterium]|nr:TonB-dependent receptor plug domain-containing protein [Bacteroidales bacterium]
MKTFVKYFLFTFFLLSGLHLKASIIDIDTLSIVEVKVVSSRTNYYREDLKTREIDSASIHRSIFSNLGDLLMSSGTSNVLTYGGDGSISTVSIRGSGSSHTRVLWNGFPLNSLTTGVADISLIPVSFFNSAKITSGSSGSLFGSGTFGGAIDLGRKVDWKKRLSISVGMEVGSFGSYKPGLKFGIGNAKVQYDLNFSFNHVLNNFSYTDFEKAGQPKVISSHNSMKSIGLIQNIQFLLPKNNMLQIGAWYFVKHNELPVAMGSYGESLQS